MSIIPLHCDLQYKIYFLTSRRIFHMLILNVTLAYGNKLMIELFLVLFNNRVIEFVANFRKFIKAETIYLRVLLNKADGLC